jgi:cytochrome c
MRPKVFATRSTRHTNVSISWVCRPGCGKRRLCLGLAIALLVVVSERAASAQDGPRLFQRCYACHSLDPAERHLSGPNLRELFGRRAGVLDEFEYSLPLREAGRRGLVWTVETLDRFLEDPEELVPGVRMSGVRLRDPGERRALIRWLQGATR